MQVRDCSWCTSVDGNGLQVGSAFPQQQLPPTSSSSSSCSPSMSRTNGAMKLRGGESKAGVMWSRR